ncbi:helix-turn-helix domain-containing protein [Gordonia sp. SID5947]|uniref:helix-turn-helix domain-containing protein n=1 Tax=Gordonia sp. SID5947 TaxID=2690315 RepID=UPI001F44ED4D|nr:helix-turn-helix domain-containing protein [Gordonia sp. SID5947]
MAVDDLPRSVRRLLAAGLSQEIVTTLQAYLDCGGDAQRTARTLNIHRSTLYYRLGRIRSALDADLGDGRLRTELHVGLRLHDMRKAGSASTIGPVSIPLDPADPFGSGVGAQASPGAREERDRTIG